MKIKINFDDGTVKYADNVTKRKLSATLTKLRAQNAVIKGTARVTYSPNMYNEFDFDDEADFKAKAYPCVEQELAREFSR